MVHQQGIQGAIEHYRHPERVAWQSMCATDEGVLKGEQWCRRCIWGNLLPEWKQAFGSVDKIQSGDFVSLWTGRIDHLANKFSAAQGDASIVHPLKATLAAPRLLLVVIFEGLRLMRATFAVLSLSQRASFLFFHVPPFRSLKAVEITLVRTRPGHAVAKAVRRATAG